MQSWRYATASHSAEPPKHLNRNEAEGKYPCLTRHGVFVFAATGRRDRKGPTPSSLGQLQPTPRRRVSCQRDSHLSLAPHSGAFDEALCRRQGGTLIPNPSEGERGGKAGLMPCRDVNDGKALRKVEQGTPGDRRPYIAPVLTSFRSYLSVYLSAVPCFLGLHLQTAMEILTDCQTSCQRRSAACVSLTSAARSGT